MQRLDGRLIVSAHDLVGFLGCEHVTVLDKEVLKVHCRTPEEMRLANALCRFVELSGSVDWAALTAGSPEAERELTRA